MWIIQFMPAWVFSLLFFIGIAGFLVTKTIKILPNKQLIMYASIGLIFLGTYMTGAKSNNDAWLEKVAILEKKVLELAPKSQKVNSNIDAKLVEQKQATKDNTKTIIEYIDREVKTTCELPQEIVNAHNKAVK